MAAVETTRSRPRARVVRSPDSNGAYVRCPRVLDGRYYAGIRTETTLSRLGLDRIGKPCPLRFPAQALPMVAILPRRSIVQTDRSTQTEMLISFDRRFSIVVS